MAQIFPRWTNYIPAVFLLLASGSGAAVVGFFWYYGSPRYTDVGYRPEQPVPFSHKLHAGELGMDCRYCHFDVEHSYEANVPATQVCMNCHQMVATDRPTLARVIESHQTGKPLQWIRVHKTPDYAYFDHSVHLDAGVGCQSCHGPIEQMETVAQHESLSMGWCLDCHRNPAPHIRDTSQWENRVTNTVWDPDGDKGGEAFREEQLAAAERLIAEQQIAPPEDCSACHR